MIEDETFSSPLLVSSEAGRFLDEVASSSVHSSLLGPTLVAAAIMLVIVGLLWAWEKLVHELHRSTPPSLKPVVDSSLAEIGGLGFIGLLLGLCHKYAGSFVHEYPEIVEAFEFLHTTFFQVAIAFFLTSGFIVRNAILKIQQFRHAEDDIMEILLFSPSHTGTDFLAVRHRFLLKYQLPRNFHLDLTPAFATYLMKLIHFQPQIWLPLIPVLSLGQALDMKHGAISASSSNALATTGFFYSTPAVWYMVLIWQATTLVLFFFNVIKIVAFKNRAAEAVSTCNNDDYASAETVGSHSPTGLSVPSQTDEHLAIPEWYLLSLQYHAWLSISFVLLIVSDVLMRDYQALVAGAEVGDPAGLVPETIWFTLFAILSTLQLTQTQKLFWGFCLTNFDRDQVSRATIQEQLKQYQHEVSYASRRQLL
ncbi:hypothetical protein ACHAXR_004473 [Thalassiosira sp. AJA248-18]